MTQVAQVAARRLHAAGRELELRGQSEPLRQESLRSLQGLRAGHAGRRLAEYPRRASRRSGEIGEGADRAHQGEPRQIQHRQSRRRHHAACSRAELFKLTLKLDATSVPFGGAGPAIQSAVAGHTPIAFTALPPTAPQVQGGKLRGLAVTSAKRSSALPDVPTMAEAGVKDQESETMQGIFAARRRAEGAGRSPQRRDRQGDGACPT